MCGLALAHVPNLQPVMQEFARVLRVGGDLVISDAHHELVFRGSVVKARGPGGRPGLVATYRHTPGAFVRAALPVGLQVRRCEEPTRAAGSDVPRSPPQDVTIGDVNDWPWSLLDVIPEAARAAWEIPATIIWHFQRAAL